LSGFPAGAAWIPGRRCVRSAVGRYSGFSKMRFKIPPFFTFCQKIAQKSSNRRDAKSLKWCQLINKKNIK
jgi:hypothetical protein